MLSIFNLICFSILLLEYFWLFGCFLCIAWIVYFLNINAAFCPAQIARMFQVHISSDRKRAQQECFYHVWTDSRKGRPKISLRLRKVCSLEYVQKAQIHFLSKTYKTWCKVEKVKEREMSEEAVKQKPEESKIIHSFKPLLPISFWLSYTPKPESGLWQIAFWTSFD